MKPAVVPITCKRVSNSGHVLVTPAAADARPFLEPRLRSPRSSVQERHVLVSEGSQTVDAPGGTPGRGGPGAAVPFSFNDGELRKLLGADGDARRPSAEQAPSPRRGVDGDENASPIPLPRDLPPTVPDDAARMAPLGDRWQRPVSPILEQDK